MNLSVAVPGVNEPPRVLPRGCPELAETRPGRRTTLGLTRMRRIRRPKGRPLRVPIRY